MLDKVLNLPNASRPEPDVICAGQPDATQLRAVARAGVRRIIDLRQPDEIDWDEAGAVHALGLEYFNLPVAGPDDLTADKAAELDRALAAADGPVLVHCGSANRVGALFALRAFYLHGEESETALEVGRRAGLSGLEAFVRDCLRGQGGGY